MRQNLAASTIKSAKPNPSGKPFKLTDGAGLYLMVNRTGKYWRYNYRHNGKHKTLALGVYPDVSLKDAREKHADARQLVSTGVDPSYRKKQNKLSVKIRHTNSFEAVAREWFGEFKSTWVENHAVTIMSRLERDVFPIIGSRPISEIEPPEVLAVMHKVKDRGALETAHRIRSICGQVFRYAVATGRAQRDQTADLKGALPSPRQRRLAAIKTPQELRKLLLATEAFEGTHVVKCALKLSALVMLRPGELRHGKWSEIDFNTATWTIPIARMKTRKMTKDLNESCHVVPLSTQAVAILQDLHPFTCNFEYIFTGARNRNRPMSENAVRAALRGMGYTNDQMTAHGFRATASTFLNEMGFNPDAIEAQIAHKNSNEIRAAYNRAIYMKERRDMLQEWADYLEKLKDGDGEGLLDLGKS